MSFIFSCMSALHQSGQWLMHLRWIALRRQEGYHNKVTSVKDNFNYCQPHSVIDDSMEGVFNSVTQYGMTNDACSFPLEITSSLNSLLLRQVEKTISFFPTWGFILMNKIFSMLLLYFHLFHVSCSMVGSIFPSLKAPLRK